MTDEQLAAALNISIVALGRLPYGKRKTLKLMLATADELNAWSRGEGPKPKGVLIDGPRSKRRGRQHGP